MTIAASAEQAKYERVWRELPDYRINSPGELVLLQWLKIVKPKPNASVIDFGCGPGRASMVMGLMGFDITMIDIAFNCLDPDVAELTDNGRLRFVCADFAKPGFRILRATHGYCCDVMEHLPPECVDQAIENIMASVRDSFFLVSLREDAFGADLGEQLHLTVEPFTWWRDTFRQHGDLHDARDLIQNAVFRVRR